MARRHESELSVTADERVGVVSMSAPSATGWTVVIKCAGAIPPLGPGLVPTEWLNLATLASQRHDSKSKPQLARHMLASHHGLLEAPCIWTVSVAPCTGRSVISWNAMSLLTTCSFTMAANMWLRHGGQTGPWRESRERSFGES